MSMKSVEVVDDPLSRLLFLKLEKLWQSLPKIFGCAWLIFGFSLWLGKLCQVSILVVYHYRANRIKSLSHIFKNQDPDQETIWCKLTRLNNCGKWNCTHDDLESWSVGTLLLWACCFPWCQCGSARVFGWHPVCRSRQRWFVQRWTRWGCSAWGRTLQCWYWRWGNSCRASQLVVNRSSTTTSPVLFLLFFCDLLCSCFHICMLKYTCPYW